MPITAQQVIDRIKAQVGVPWAEETVDTIKAGDAHTKVTGVTATMFATMEVLRKSAEAGNNLIICHEPTFYSHLDELAPLEKDEVQQTKLAYIRKHKLVVFRFHDHIHRMKPDGIVAGVAEALGWQKRERADDPAVFDVEPTKLGKLAKLLKKKLDAHALRFVGDADLVCSRVALSVGAGGSSGEIAKLQRDDIDVLLCGETREWETVEYVHDAAQSGKKKGLIVLGHVPSEQAGMEWCARWLSKFVTEVPVKFIPSGDPFTTP
ncbi:MAG TPA: Nif3-like dinuclear metal center hexameric protein [Planctomycetota bacterium]|jgi:putative NIF3 family GTP cyclohydrolase 1 type 2